MAGKAIYTHRRIVEHRRALRRGEALCQFLKLIPNCRVGARKPVDGKVAFEHASRRTEVIDRVKVPITIRREQFVRRRRLFSLVPPVAVDDHLNTADLCHDVRTPRQFRDGRLPACKHFVAATRIGSDSDWAAKMVEDDSRIRECFCEIGQFRVCGW